MDSLAVGLANVSGCLVGKVASSAYAGFTISLQALFFTVTWQFKDCSFLNLMTV